MSGANDFVPPVPELKPGYAEALKNLRAGFGEPKNAKDRRRLQKLEAQLYRDHHVDPSEFEGMLWARPPTERRPEMTSRVAPEDLPETSPG